MKIKLPNALLTIDILTLLFILVVNFLPDTPVRIALALPFTLFFPGYAFTALLFPAKGYVEEDAKPAPGTKKEAGKGLDSLQRIALSFGLSIALVTLIGLAMNFSPWGIRFEPILYAISAFILVVSVGALLRQARLPGGSKLVFQPAWDEPWQTKAVVIGVIVLAVAGIATFGVFQARQASADKYTQFYILGLNGKTEEYPSAFKIDNGAVIAVTYGAGETIAAQWGLLTVGIENNEGKNTAYTLRLQFDSQAGKLNYGGVTAPEVGPISLKDGEKWKGQIGFAPAKTGNQQKVELFLFKDGSADPYQSLHFYVNVE